MTVVTRVWIVVVGLAVVTYFSPLSVERRADVATMLYTGSAVLLAITAVRAAFIVSGIDRLAWTSLSLTFVFVLALSFVDPITNDGSLSSGQKATPIVALAFAAVVMLLGREGITRLGLVRLTIDVVWLTLGLATAIWFWAFTPIADMGGTSFLAAASSLVIGMPAVVGLLLFVRLSGVDRLAFAAMGTGAAVCGAASLLNIRFTYLGTLQFGEWYDLLWMPGYAAVGYASLFPDLGSRLRPHQQSARSEQVVTALPVLGLLIPLLSGQAWTNTPSVAMVAMVVVLAIRVIVLISQNNRLSGKLSDMAHRDELTGLLNRRALLEHLELLAGKMSSASWCTVLYLDLDGFKDVNDQWGHAAGDRVLEVTAERLRATVRSGDVVARLGGDEFVVAALDSDGAELAKRLIPILAQPIPWGDASLDVGCSIGVASASFDGVPELLPDADLALYEAKGNGRGRVEFASQQQGPPALLGCQ